MIETTRGADGKVVATTLTGKDQERYGILALRAALKLEAECGIQMTRGASAYAITKKRFDFKGSKAAVLDQLNHYNDAEVPASTEPDDLVPACDDTVFIERQDDGMTPLHDEADLLDDTPVRWVNGGTADPKITTWGALDRNARKTVELIDGEYVGGYPF